jgi:hypothetical protein
MLRIRSIRSMRRQTFDASGHRWNGARGVRFRPIIDRKCQGKSDRVKSSDDGIFCSLSEDSRIVDLIWGTF